jgi:hypothetical protein
MWSKWPCDARIRSAFGGFFIASGHEGLLVSHGSQQHAFASGRPQ